MLEQFALLQSVPQTMFCGLAVPHTMFWALATAVPQTMLLDQALASGLM